MQEKQPESETPDATKRIAALPDATKRIATLPDAESLVFVLQGATAWRTAMTAPAKTTTEDC
jgi:hypothetical protein